MDQTVPAYAAEVADYGRSRDPEPGEGALVKNVRPESPAWDVGIEPGMRVLAVNGEALTDMIVWLWEADDDTVELDVFDPRDGTVTPVELDRFPGEDWGLEFDGPIFDGMRTCVNACVFCFMTMLPKGGRSTLYIRDDDYRLSFLQGNFVTLTNLTDEDVQNVIQRNMSPMNVSVHAVSPDVRRRMMGRNAQRGMDVLETIMAAGIEIHAQIVLCPGMNDGEELEKTLRFCEEHEQITSLGIVPLGFTKHQNRFSWSYSDKPELARETIAMIRPYQDRAFERFGRHTFQMSDEFYLDAGIEPHFCIEGLARFGGVGRRFEHKGEKNDILVVDDYGHHPVEIAATLATARTAYPDRRVVVAFQPHRFSRTQALFGEFCHVLGTVDKLLLTEIYPASEKPIPGVNGQNLAQGIRQVSDADVSYFQNFDEMVAALPDILKPGDLFLTIGAGNVTTVGPRFLALE